MKWTKENEERLKELALAKTIPEIALELKLDEWVVRNKLSRLKVKPVKKELKAKEPTIETVRADISKRVQKSNELQLSKQVKLLSEELVKTEKERDTLLGVGGVETYTIKPSGKESEKSEATTISLASDWHIEEEVKSSQVNGLNKFDINIAKERAEKFFKVTAQLIKVHQKEYEINTHILALLGDFISGSIHDDLKEGNKIQPTEAIWEAQKLIASGIEYLLKNTDVKLIIPCSAGNHSRITEKQRIQTEYGNSLEILMYRQMEKYFASEDRVKFIINDSYLTYVKVYDFVCRFSHGHALKYGGGIGGIFIPAFKAISQWNKSKNADWDFFGHFHQLKDGGNFVSNGSLIGFNSFAVRIKADYEKPKQAFIIIDKERGMDVVRKITL